MISIGGYYGRSLTELSREMEGYREAGLAGCKFKVGGASPEEDADRADPRRTRGGRRRFPADERREPGLTRAQAIRFELCKLIEDCDMRWFEEPVQWANDRRSHARRAHARRHAGLRGAERVLRGRLPRSDGRRGDRRVQLRRLLVGRPDRVAPRRRDRPLATTSRWGITRSRRSRRTCSRRCRTAPTSSASIPIATRSGGTSSPIAPTPSTAGSRALRTAGSRLGARRRLHRALPRRSRRRVRLRAASRRSGVAAG